MTNLILNEKIRVNTHVSEKTQLDRFREAARQIGADESDDALDKVFGKLDVRKKPEPDNEAKPEKG